MSIEASSKVNHELAQRAYDAFAQNRQLIIYINRPRSLLSLPTSNKPLIIDRQLRDECLRQTTPKVEEQCEYFFSNLSGDTSYINQKTIDEFTKITRKEFPDFKFTPLFAVVDTEENIELMPADVVPEGFATMSGDNLLISLKVRAFVAKLIPN
jgi:hypothetical protein